MFRKTQRLSCLCCCLYLAAHQLDDVAGPFDQLCVGCKDPLFQKEIVFQTDPDITTQKCRLGNHRHFHGTNCETRPVTPRWQLIHHGKEVSRIGPRRPANTQADLEEGRTVQ